MNLLPWILQIKALHIGLVLASGLLFALRGAAVLAGRRWAMRAAWRRLSVGIDNLLLAAGLGLWHLLSIDPLASPWLATKLLLLLLYIVLGSLALKRAPTPGGRRLAYAAALATYACMASVAIAHHPLGALQRLWAAAG